MKEFWNQRFNQIDYVYGVTPNEFFKQQIDQLKPGSLLLPLEGEGRNAFYAAKNGFKVSAFDYSETGRQKALKLFEANALELNYSIAKAEEFDFGEHQYDYIALIYAHLSPDIRLKVHERIERALKPGGTLILECFHPKQLEKSYNSGGPKQEDMLYSTAILKKDFKALELSQIEAVEIDLNEGDYHQGKAYVSRLIGQKPII